MMSAVKYVSDTLVELAANNPEVPDGEIDDEVVSSKVTSNSILEFGTIGEGKLATTPYLVNAPTVCESGVTVRLVIAAAVSTLGLNPLKTP